MGGETQAGSAGVRGAGHLWRSGRYEAERDHCGHGGNDGEHGEGVGEPVERGCTGETGGGDGGGHRDTDGGTELVEGVDDAQYQPGLVLTDVAEGRGGRADEQRAAAQREQEGAGKGYDVDVAACRQADEQCVADGDQGQADDGDGTGADGADEAAGRDGSDHRARAGGRKNRPVSSALRPRRCCRYCEPRKRSAMSTPAATNIRKAPAATGRRASRLRCSRGVGTVRSTTTNTPYRTMAAAMGTSVPRSVQPPHRRGACRR